MILFDQPERGLSNHQNRAPYFDSRFLWLAPAFVFLLLPLLHRGLI